MKVHIYDFSKANLAKVCSVSPRTVAYWLNVLFLEEMESMGYNRNQKILTPRQWSWITDKLVVIDE